MKKVFEVLAIEESKHKLRFELEYDELVNIVKNQMDDESLDVIQEEAYTEDIQIQQTSEVEVNKVVPDKSTKKAKGYQSEEL